MIDLVEQRPADFGWLRRPPATDFAPADLLQPGRNSPVAPVSSRISQRRERRSERQLGRFDAGKEFYPERKIQLPLRPPGSKQRTPPLRASLERAALPVLSVLSTFSG